jgi:hypothetical protein
MKRDTSKDWHSYASNELPVKRLTGDKPISLREKLL